MVTRIPPPGESHLRHSAWARDDAPVNIKLTMSFKTDLVEEQ